MNKDGWYKVYGRKVYVENGKVRRALTLDGQSAVYPYVEGKYGGLNNISGYLTVSALRSRMARGTVYWF